ncbi:MAG TPA: hypothetical protein VK211_21085 [Kamptonema sp.]|nr:hypothetical protein [Kamptonema sp.]
MTRAMQLLNSFIAGCVASSFLGWVASLHPVAFKVISALICTAVIVWGLAWLLDDTITTKLKIEPQSLQAVLVSGLAMLLIGLGVVLCS